VRIEINVKVKLMNIEPTNQARKTIEHWLQTHLLGELSSWDMLPQVVGDFPENTGCGRLTELKQVKSIDLGSMQLKSLSQSVVSATFNVTLSFSLYVSKEDYDASQKVREFVGVHDDDFSGVYIGTDATLEVCFDFELFSQPPMVLTAKLRSIGGQSTSFQID
jgi:hypothetical protein